MEELVAEPGADFFAPIAQTVRVDHASYVRNWLTVLRDDKKAIFTAASKASEAANWLLKLDAQAFPEGTRHKPRLFISQLQYVANCHDIVWRIVQ
jgi:antirestriction protein ArdC